MSELTLPEFLLARIAEVEKAGRPHWDSCRVVRWAGTGKPAQCDCHQPARGQAMCEAHRRIAESFRWYQDNAGRGSLSPAAYGLAEAHAKALALPYADHPDYRPEWRP
jgi:hypothetical protein